MARRLPPLSALRPFEAAARLESFSRAADELHLTHGAVSHQVRALEEHVGTALFLRTGKRVLLTPEGREFAERIRGALAQIAEAAEVASRRQSPNRLTVSVLPSFASRWLMPRVSRFMQRHPEYELNVIATIALANFASDDVDIAIRFGEGPWPGLHCEHYGDDVCFPAASPRFNRGRLPKTLAQIAASPLLRADRDRWDEWFTLSGMAELPKLTGPVVNDSSLLIQQALAGKGIVMARLSLVEDDLARGDLVRLGSATFPMPERYWLVCPKSRAASPKFKAFRDWMFAERGNGFTSIADVPAKRANARTKGRKRLKPPMDADGRR
jgi:LysR family transcriptional regulator, glycine cleavage system transcriptional activator